MKVNYSYLHQQFNDIDKHLNDIRLLVKSTEFTFGKYVNKFENEFSKFLNIKHTIGMNNGTDALILSLKSLNIKKEDEVITVCNTFYATVGAIVAVGAKPVFVDSDERYQMNVENIENKISKKTKAIIAVHWGGSPCDIIKIQKLCKKYKIYLIEDACPATGAEVNNKKCGTFGIVNAFSMHPLKPLHVWGDGGAIATNNTKINNFIRTYQNHGMRNRDNIEFWGINNRLQPFQAIIASRVLKKVNNYIKKRNEVAKLFDKYLSELDGYIKVPERPKEYKEAYQLYIISVKNRNRLIKYLHSNNIECKIHYPIPLHLQKPGIKLGYKKGDFPIAERQAKEIITLPCHQYLNKNQIFYTIEKIINFYKK